LNEFLRLEDIVKEAVGFYKVPKHQRSQFVSIPADQKLVSEMGKIISNARSGAQEPQTIFNTQNLGVYEYRDKLQTFVPLKIIDEESLKDKMPKNFKSVYLCPKSETYLLAGGFDSAALKTSKKAYVLEKGVLNEVIEMYKARQNYAIVATRILIRPNRPSFSEASTHGYCIGGYNVKEGALDHVERFSYERKEWEVVASLNIPRINAGACLVGKNHIFVFGGRSDGDEFYDSIERYNIELNIWNMLRVKLPLREGLCNMFCFAYGDEDNVLILGGLKKRNKGQLWSTKRARDQKDTEND
jgi:hypothetical protein